MRRVVQFLNPNNVKVLAQRIEYSGCHARGVYTKRGYDLLVEVPMVFDGLVLNHPPIKLQISGSTYATLLGGAIDFTERCRKRLDPCKLSDWEFEVGQALLDTAQRLQHEMSIGLDLLYA